MEELRSTEILDKEIQEDARKKADKIVKNSQKEAQNIIDGVSGRIETAKQEKEKLYAEKLTRFERDTNASLPLEKQRFLVSFEDAFSLFNHFANSETPAFGLSDIEAKSALI